MANVAYCANCRANFSDPAEVASITGSGKGMCVGCSSLVEVPHENASPFQPVAAAAVVDDEPAAEVDEPAADVEYQREPAAVYEPVE